MKIKTIIESLDYLIFHSDNQEKVIRIAKEIISDLEEFKEAAK